MNGTDDQRNVISTGETSATGEPDDYEDIHSATDEDFEVEEKVRACHHLNPSTSILNNMRGVDVTNTADLKNNDAYLFYDENLDEEDEAYVYKHMRGGITETVTVNVTSKKKPANVVDTEQLSRGGDGETSNKFIETRSGSRQQTIQMFKPRQSDAVLSCPCCFNIVCMDCQKHKRFTNQYRAMFVMGVVVDWSRILVYDETSRSLVSQTEQNTIEENSSLQSNNEIRRAKQGEYFAVECRTCQTQVAVLDMIDEVYYFHDCLESSSAF